MQKVRLAIDRQDVFLCDSEANREDFSKEKISGDVKMQLTYGIKDRPKFGKNLVFAFQQMIAIMAATLSYTYCLRDSKAPFSSALRSPSSAR